ncbi:MAG: cupredoxin domain-containing protein [Sulfuricaulis sp.]
MRNVWLVPAAVALALVFSVDALAQDYALTIKDHQFSPKVLTVPAGQKIKIMVTNLDPTPAEFESSDLNREKVVVGNSSIIVFIGPLDAGRYNYFDDFHRATTTGIITAK